MARQPAKRPGRPLDAASLILFDEWGNRYRLEHAGAWDPPEGDDRSGCYYEDEPIPAGAVSLYRVSQVGPALILTDSP